MKAKDIKNIKISDSPCYEEKKALLSKDLKKQVARLRDHNKWRRGEIDGMVTPQLLGETIDYIVRFCENYLMDKKKNNARL